MDKYNGGIQIFPLTLAGALPAIAYSLPWPPAATPWRNPHKLRLLRDLGKCLMLRASETFFLGPNGPMSLSPQFSYKV